MKLSEKLDSLGFICENCRGNLRVSENTLYCIKYGKECSLGEDIDIDNDESTVRQRIIILNDEISDLEGMKQLKQKDINRINRWNLIFKHEKLIQKRQVLEMEVFEITQNLIMLDKILRKLWEII